jgi:hypothetical protein
MYFGAIKVDRGSSLFSRGGTFLPAVFPALLACFAETSKNDSYFARFIAN